MNIEELKNKNTDQLSRDEAGALIRYYEELSAKYTAYEQAVKVTLNSIYGAFGNKWFHFFNINIAESITLQGQNAILYSESVLNKYFQEFFHKDSLVHSRFNIRVKHQLQKPAVIYIDTDSVVGDTMISLDDGRKIKIEDLYNEGIQSMGSTLSGHDSVSINNKVLNWSEEKGLYFAPVKRVIKHKVSKAKWKLKTKTGKEIIVTNDHSMIVFRNGKKIEVKPSEILKTDNILVSILMRYELEDIESIEYIGEFNDEYVYDIEVDDETHTFIGNDILVHNSCYVQFEEMYNSIEWLGETMSLETFILEIYKFRLKDYIIKAMEKYAEKRNTDNFLVFELETIAYNGIWMSKKKYIQNIAWDDKLEEHDRHPSLKKIKTIGFDTIQSSTPKFAREKLVEALKIIFKKHQKPSAQELQELVAFMKQSKKEFRLADIDDISFNKRTNNIEKYVVDDQIELQIGSKCPANVKAAGYYNFLLNNNKKYKNKYKLIGNGEKLKIYHVKENISDIFAYMPGEHPYEFAPQVDYDTQFEKSMIDPLNRVLTAIGLQTLDTNLIYAASLF
jgi:DNA polymerase elongation subunit (family B)